MARFCFLLQQSILFVLIVIVFVLSGDLLMKKINKRDTHYFCCFLLAHMFRYIQVVDMCKEHMP